MVPLVKLLVLVTMLAACDKLPAAPEAKAFDAMSAQAKCEATLPRAKKCTEELMLAELGSIGGGNDELVGALREDLSKTPTYSDDAEAIHRNACLGSRDDSYARGIVRCWDVTPCEAFAKCVYSAPPTSAPRR